jgi:hypothetical protein
MHGSVDWLHFRNIGNTVEYGLNTEALYSPIAQAILNTMAKTTYIRMEPALRLSRLYRRQLQISPGTPQFGLSLIRSQDFGASTAFHIWR